MCGYQRHRRSLKVTNRFERFWIRQSNVVDPRDTRILQQFAHAFSDHVTVTLNDDGTPFDWTQVTGGLLTVKSQETCPFDAFVRVRYRGAWFYIDDTDLDSKSTFGLLNQLFALQSGGAKSVMPVLTLPVGG